MKLALKARWIYLCLTLLPGAYFGVGLAVAKPDANRSTFAVQKESSRFSMEFKNAELKDVLRILGQENNVNIIVSDDITGKLTLNFRDVTFEEALDAILKSNNLISFKEGSIIRVMKSPFGEGEGDLATKIIPIHYATVKETQESIKGLLTKKGSITVDVRTNALIIRDYPSNVGKISDVVKELDSKTPQVMIETRIVEVNSDFTRDLGVQWGGRVYDPGSKGVFQVTGTSLTGGAGLSGNNFLVNLPAAVKAGAGGAIGFSLGNLGSTQQLDLQLSAMEDTGRGKILSSPRILTMNNKEAMISSGTEILIPVTSTVGGSAATTGVTTINAKLELRVTPQITPDDQILMHVKTDKKDPDFGKQVQGIPPLLTQTAETYLLVGNNETVAIGGIYTRNESQSERKIPWLWRLPLLGWLFRGESQKDVQTELLIFITPSIYRGSLPDSAEGGKPLEGIPSKLKENAVQAPPIQEEIQTSPVQPKAQGPPIQEEDHTGVKDLKKEEERSPYVNPPND